MVPELTQCERELLEINRGLLLKLAEANGVSTMCHNCHEPLTGEEIREAIDTRLWYPVCADCYSDFLQHNSGACRGKGGQ